MPKAGRRTSRSRPAGRLGPVASGRAVRGVRRPDTDFFLRAESLFTTATYLEELSRDSLRSYGGVSLHEQSHGESFLAVIINRFGPNGFYLPRRARGGAVHAELPHVPAADSRARPRRLAVHHRHALADPARISRRDDLHVRRGRAQRGGLRGCEPVRLTQSFLGARERFLDQLFAD